MFEICLKRGWASLAHKALDLCKMVDKRMWSVMSPLRQFRGIPSEVVQRAERKEYPWYRYFFLDPPELAELLGLPKAGRLVHRLVHQFPLRKCLRTSTFFDAHFIYSPSFCSRPAYNSLYAAHRTHHHARF